MYNIGFHTAVSSAGAFWEFNPGTTATFTALNKGTVLGSFVYSNANCCYSAEFIGFQGFVFDTISVSNITGTDFYMDTLTFASAEIPEPAGIALFGITGLGMALAARRRKKADKAA